MYFANVILHLQNAPCSDRVKQFLAAAAAIHIREGFVLLMLLHHQQMERKLHSQNNLSHIMALESQRRVRREHTPSALEGYIMSLPNAVLQRGTS